MQVGPRQNTALNNKQEQSKETRKTKQQKINDKTVKVCLRFFLKMGVEDDSLMSLGSLFHSFGPAKEKDLEPADRESLCSQRRD